MSFTRLLTETPYYQRIAMTSETPRNQRYGYSGNKIVGYFKAPVTANYRFYVSCDDVCQVSLGSADKDPSTATIIYS